MKYIILIGLLWTLGGRAENLQLNNDPSPESKAMGMLEKIKPRAGMMNLDGADTPVDAFSMSRDHYDFSASFEHTFESVFKEIPLPDFELGKPGADALSPFMNPDSLSNYHNIPGFLEH